MQDCRTAFSDPFPSAVVGRLSQQTKHQDDHAANRRAVNNYLANSGVERRVIIVGVLFLVLSSSAKGR